MSSEPGDDFGTRAIAPVAFRYPTGWLSWQAVLGDLAARGNSDARLRIEVTGSADLPSWSAELEWGENHERVAAQPSLPAALSGLWMEVIARHAIYAGDLSKRGPALYEHGEFLDVQTQAVVGRLLQIARSAFGAEWTITLSYHPVAKADERIHARLVARNGEIAVTAGGASLIEGARALMRAAAPYFPKQRRRE